MANSPWSRDAVQSHIHVSSQDEIEDADTREKAIAELRLIAEERDLAVAHADSAQVIDELLRAIGYADVADAWNAVSRERT